MSSSPRPLRSRRADRARSRVRVALGATVLSAAGMMGAGAARAQTRFTVDRVDPSPPGAEWFSLDSLDLRGPLRPALGLTADEAYHASTATARDGTVSVYQQAPLFTHVAGALVLGNAFRLALDVPLAVWQQGQQTSAIRVGRGADATTVTPASASHLQASLGDVRASADWRITAADGPFALGVGVAVYVPTLAPVLASVAYAGDGQLRALPQVKLAGDAGPLAYAASFGWRFGLASLQDGDALDGGAVLGASVGARLLERKLLVGPEVTATTGLHGAGAVQLDGPTTIDALLGAHLAVGDLRIGLGGGTGLTSQTPSLRGVLSIQWAPSPAAPPPAAVEAPEPPVEPVKVDADGAPGAEDACPEATGGGAADPVTTGRCPAPPSVPEPAAPPAPAPEPAPALARIEGGEINFVGHLQFAYNSADLLPASDALLSAVQTLLVDHPEIKRLRVEGHTDAVGPRAANRSLSEQRAAAVVRWLTRHGVDGARLRSQGFGEMHPVDTNGSKAGRTNNRRVELHIEDAPEPARLDGPRPPNFSSALTPDPARSVSASGVACGEGARRCAFKVPWLRVGGSSLSQPSRARRVPAGAPARKKTRARPARRPTRR